MAQGVLKAGVDFKGIREACKPNQTKQKERWKPEYKKCNNKKRADKVPT
jgi:hypothetical protein